MARPRRVYEPRPAAVRAGGDGLPRAVGPAAVAAVREEWLVEDRWWAPHPLRRHYFELALADGRALTVFRVPADDGCHPSSDKRREGDAGRWFRQPA